MFSDTFLILFHIKIFVDKFRINLLGKSDLSNNITEKYENKSPNQITIILVSDYPECWISAKDHGAS